MAKKLATIVEDYISAAYISFKDKDTEPEGKLVRAMVKELLGNSKEPLPALRTVQLRVKDMKEKDKALEKSKKEVDISWELSTLSDHPLPPEALPKVLILQQHTRGTPPPPKTLPEAGTELPLHPLTIREAAWVARLYTLIGDIRSLHLWAIGYAMAERVSFLAGHSFDSSNMDKGVFENSTRRKH